MQGCILRDSPSPHLLLHPEISGSGQHCLMQSLPFCLLMLKLLQTLPDGA